MNETLVLGIGNTLLSDEGVGIHVIHYLNEQFPAAETDGLRYLDGGNLSFTLAADIESADNLIVVDAAQLNAPPGTVRCFIDDDMDRFLGKAKRSVHEVGLLDLMDIARLTESVPARRALVGIQPASIDWGDQPTNDVAKAIPTAAGLIRQLIIDWHQASGVSFVKPTTT